MDQGDAPCFFCQQPIREGQPTVLTNVGALVITHEGCTAEDMVPVER